MNFELISAVIFIVVLSILLFLKRKNVAIQKIFFPFLYFILYRTKFGIKKMDRAAKTHPKLLKWFGIIGVWVGFAGMVLIAVLLIQNLYTLLTVPTAKGAITPVLPIKVKGVFYVPFFYWVICIFIIATLHEFCHGIISRLYKINIKSSGLAFLGILLPIIPAAFVEPDEKSLRKRPDRQQLSVFAAGPFSNIVLGLVLWLILFLVSAPIVNAVFYNDGVLIVDYTKKDNVTYPAQQAGIEAGELITEIDSVKITTLENFTTALHNKKPGDTLNIVTNRTNYSLILAENPEKINQSYLGVYVAQHQEVKPGFEARYGQFTPKIIIWLFGLFYFLFALNIGIGLFNLLPLGPIDGGRMVQVVLLKWVKDKKKATKIWLVISWFFTAIIVLNLGIGIFR